MPSLRRPACTSVSGHGTRSHGSQNILLMRAGLLGTISQVLRILVMIGAPVADDVSATAVFHRDDAGVISPAPGANSDCAGMQALTPNAPIMIVAHCNHRMRNDRQGWTNSRHRLLSTLRNCAARPLEFWAMVLSVLCQHVVRPRSADRPGG